MKPLHLALAATIYLGGMLAAQPAPGPLSMAPAAAPATCPCAAGNWYDANRKSCVTSACGKPVTGMPDGDKGGGYFAWNNYLFIDTACVGCNGVDVQLTNFTVKPVNPIGLTDLQYSFVMKNNGSVASGPVQMNMWISASPSCSPPVGAIGNTNVGNIPANGQVGPSSTSTEALLPPGNYFLCWQVDPQNQIKECAPNGENNNLTITPITLVAVCPQADLVTKKLFTNTTTAPKANAFTYVAWVFNQGGATAGASATKVELVPVSGGPGIVIDTIPGALATSGKFPHQGVRTVPNLGAVPPGQYRLRATADSGATIAECNEGNNVLMNPAVITVI